MNAPGHRAQSRRTVRHGTVGLDGSGVQVTVIHPHEWRYPLQRMTYLRQFSKRISIEFYADSFRWNAVQTFLHWKQSSLRTLTNLTLPTGMSFIKPLGLDKV